MPVSRRTFLQLSGAGALAVAAAPRLVFANGNAAASMDALLVVFLRGGLDGLHAVVPHGDADYYALRPTLAVPRPGSGEGAALDLDGFFGLHPALAPLLPLQAAGRCTVVHSTGYRQGSRSHFSCQDGMERAADAALGLDSGWLGRWLETLGQGATFQAIGVGRAVQGALRGTVPAVGLTSIAGFGLASTAPRAAAYAPLLADLSTREDLVNASARQALEAIDTLAAADPAQYPVEHGATYPDTPFGTQIREIAQLLKSDLGLRVACCDIGGWDSHASQAQALPALLDELARTLAAFDTDLGERMQRVHVVAMTDFGRRVGENGSGGTDHGTGQAMFLLGGGLAGAPVLADWPGLHAAALVDGDLDVRTDYRTVLAELLDRRLGAPDLAHVFPGFVTAAYIGAYA